MKLQYLFFFMLTVTFAAHSVTLDMNGLFSHAATKYQESKDEKYRELAREIRDAMDKPSKAVDFKLKKIFGIKELSELPPKSKGYQFPSEVTSSEEKFEHISTQILPKVKGLKGYDAFKDAVNN